MVNPNYKSQRLKKINAQKQIFGDTTGCPTYKTPANAIAAIKRKTPDALNEFRWLIGSNNEGRFFVVFLEASALDLCLTNFYFISC